MQSHALSVSSYVEANIDTGDESDVDIEEVSHGTRGWTRGLPVCMQLGRPTTATSVTSVNSLDVEFWVGNFLPVPHCLFGALHLLFWRQGVQHAA